MGATATKYSAKTPNQQGLIHYSAEENRVWSILYERQMEAIRDRACAEYLTGLDILGLNVNAIPQLPDVNARLEAATGWRVEPVPALILFKEFFALLASRRFPAATFIRTFADIDYLQEPDIFHEIYGHCPLLTEPTFADFVQRYGQMGLNASKEDRVLLARLFWFTVEFGLIRTPNGLKIYGAGILSSKGETEYALESDFPQRRDFDALTALRTPYRIDIYQSVYYVIDRFPELYDAMDESLLPLLEQARSQGDFNFVAGADAAMKHDLHPC